MHYTPTTISALILSLYLYHLFLNIIMMSDQTLEMRMAVVQSYVSRLIEPMKVVRQLPIIVTQCHTYRRHSAERHEIQLGAWNWVGTCTELWQYTWCLQQALVALHRVPHDQLSYRRGWADSVKCSRSICICCSPRLQHSLMLCQLEGGRMPVRVVSRAGEEPLLQPREHQSAKSCV